MPWKPDHTLRIVTCCYCGARSTLAPEGGQRLVCHGCGAPIRRIEAVAAKPMPRAGAARGAKPATPHPAERKADGLGDGRGEHLAKDRPVRRKKGKRKRGGLLHRIAKTFDDLDLDDIFDLFD
jgi:hypothetical protein